MMSFDPKQRVPCGVPAIVPHASLTPEYSIPRIILGCWQLAGGHGVIDDRSAFSILEDALARGFTAFDCADIYTGVEERLGRFRSYIRERHGSLADRIQIHTKFVPDLDAIERGGVNESYVRRICERSLSRLGVETLDLVQFHWWDYSRAGMEDAAGVLLDLKCEGKIRNIGVTNFDVPQLRMLIEAGIPIVSNQVQFSLLDSRPHHGMVEFARNNGVALLAYGSIAGGFLSERYLNKPEPEEYENRSLAKYALMIEERGGWEVFQGLLRTLAAIADENGVDIATVAARAILAEPSVAALIIGTRSGAHLDSNQAIFSGHLKPEDIARIEGKAESMRRLSGGIYSYEREREGKHGAIMRYNLNG